MSNKIKTYTLGITGGIGSGKTAVSDYLINSKNITVADADIVSKPMMQPGMPAYEQIVEHFGKNIIQDDLSLNRKKLRDIIFKQNNHRKWLEGLLHPIINQQIMLILKQARSEYSALISPLLLETGQNNLTHRIVVIDTLPEIQIKRTMLRDGISRNKVKAIMSTQLERNKRIAQADDIISNNASLNDLHTLIDNYHTKWLNLAKEHAKAISSNT